MVNKGTVEFSQNTYDPNHFLDVVKEKLELPCDTALGTKLGISPKVIDDIRNRKSPVGASVLLLIAERCKVDVAELRLLMGDRRHKIRVTVPTRFISF